MGIIGAVLMLPGLACSACVGGAAAAVGADSVAILIIVLGIAPIVLGILGGVKGKSAPLQSFIFLLVSTVCAGTGWYFTAYTSFFIWRRSFCSS